MDDISDTRTPCNSPEVQQSNGECSRSQEEGGATFIEHVSVDRDLNEGFDQPGHEDQAQCEGEEEDLKSNERDDTKMCDKIAQEEANNRTNQWESHNYAWGWLSPSHPADPRMAERWYVFFNL